jgi:hypothetical protein
MQQKKEAYCCLDEVAKHGTRLRTRQKMITTVRVRIQVVTELEFGLVMNVVEVVKTIIETVV